MADDAVAQIISGVAAILTPVSVAIAGLWVWTVKRKRVRRERLEAKRRARQRALVADAASAAPSPLASRLDAIRTETLEELRQRAVDAEQDLARVRGERDQLGRDLIAETREHSETRRRMQGTVDAVRGELQGEAREHLLTRGRLQEALEEMVNVRSLAHARVSEMEVRLMAVEISLAEVRGRERGLVAYVLQVYPRVDELRRENLALLLLLPDGVRELNPGLGEASLNQIPAPPAYLLPPAYDEVEDDTGD